MSVVFLIFGVLLAGIAVFADTLGLDQNAGWSRARITLFLFGALIMLCAVLYYRYADKIHTLFHFQLLLLFSLYMFGLAVQENGQPGSPPHSIMIVRQGGF